MPLLIGILFAELKVLNIFQAKLLETMSQFLWIIFFVFIGTCSAEYQNPDLEKSFVMVLALKVSYWHQYQALSFLTENFNSIFKN